MYDGSQASIKTDLWNIRFVNIKKGVEQGDLLFAILFCAALAAVILRTKDACNTGFSTGGHIISNLSYADDIALTNTSSANLQIFVIELAKKADEIGLEINFSKTEWMITDKHKLLLNLTKYIQYKPIKQVTEFFI